MNDDFDTGTVTGPGEYQMADKTYAELLDRLAKQHFSNVSRDLQKVVLNYYKDPNAPFATREEPQKMGDRPDPSQRTQGLHTSAR